MFLKRFEKKTTYDVITKEISLNAFAKKLFNFFKENADAATGGVPSKHCC